MDESGNTWKGNGQGDAQNSNSFGGPVFPTNQGSPAGNMNMPPNNFQGPPPGSNTPQYTASPAPSGSSTPGPPNSGFPPPQQNSQGPPFNGPAGSSGPFGSPSSNGPQFGRPGSSGPAFGPQFGPSGPNNFVGGGPPFMGPSGSFHGQPHQGHPMGNSIGPGGHHMMTGPQVDRLDPR